ncbi:hypothetical protein [Neobacillus massiliamazoniensis]|uniref:DUF2680 domain-containing protein n=1 Tax=Neobacillus massiliamazoniensis TaxID=1499688 RepID=A0A0U1NSQ3_9BACI|nr:hypothetical protein [Neobacillus massiliamazoniensis]CRK81073.1 hypothetical protein BN000_00971 [Neobacillus massiliamazoniensis]
MTKKIVWFIIFFVCFSSLSTYIDAEQLKQNREAEEKGKYSNNREGIKQDKPDFSKKDKEDGKIDVEEEKESPKNGERIIDSDLTCTKDIHFTPAQKRRLDQIYHRIYKDYVSLIETYAWSGALTPEQELLRYKMLKNYILTFKKRNYRWCSEYEEDEWEEEWFNNDND